MGLKVLDEYLSVTEQGEIVCSKCEHVYCNTDKSYKDYAVVKESEFKDLGLASVNQSYYIDRKVIFRQFFCPGCATNIENDVVYADEKSLNDKKIAL
jgi:N-methylhydantoinase B